MTTTTKRHGLHLAVVADNRDRGARLKLTFPWLSDDDASAWARIAVPLAGAGAGTYALPEIGDQVVVVFEHGDIDRPIVVGALWSAAQPPPESNAGGDNPAALIKSRAGHRVIFDDVHGRVTIVDATRESSITLDADGDAVRIHSAGDLTIRAAGNVAITANAVAIAATDTLAVSGRDAAVRAATLSVTAGTQLVAAGASVTARSGVES
jgi:uncharacterized protein involved in type VI secretion and phage assembly|nr:phage baseplate assembly protein V [Kofleriaceae bacterium]